MALLNKIERSSLLRSGGLSAIALAIATMAMPGTALAQDGGWRGRGQQAQQQGQSGNPGGGPRWNRGQSDNGAAQQQSPRQVEQRSEWRAQRIENRSQNRATQVERQGDRDAARAMWRGNPERAQRIDNQSERQARQIERQGQWRANQVDRAGERRAEAIREAQRASAQQNAQQNWRNDRDRDQNRDWQRNRTYRNDDRNRTYRSDNNWRDDDRNWRNDNARNYDRNDRRNDYRRWSRTWRNDSRYDWQDYRARNRNVYRSHQYYAPYRNYSYRRLSIGFSLGSLFYGSNYWISDPWQYRLPAVYGPYRWVRYYDDVLLVNIYTGEVVDVIYDFFW